MSQRVSSSVAVEYPSSDGGPMAENEAQRAAIVYAMEAMFHERARATGAGPGDRP